MGLEVSSAPHSTITNALLPSGKLVNIEVKDGLISNVTDKQASDLRPAADSNVTDVEGRMLLPSMVEPHAHLDKALTAPIARNKSGDLLGAIDAIVAAGAAGKLDHDSMVARASRAIEMLLARGVTFVRSHIDVGAGFEAAFVRAVVEARSHYTQLIDVELVALTHSPMTGPAGSENRAALAMALEAGADVVGGCPHLEDGDPEASIDIALAAAIEAGVGLDLHMDETLDPTVSHLDYLARRIIESGFAHPVVASHCVSLGVQDLETQKAVSARLAEANVAVVALPQTNLFLQGRDHPVAMPRALTPVGVLQDHGVTVAAGGDNVQDPFNPMGRGDQLEIAALMVMMAHLSPADAYDTVSNGARKAIGLAVVNFEVGSRADFVAVPAQTLAQAVADAPADRLVFRRGQLVATTTKPKTTFG